MENIDNIIKARKTQKVLANKPLLITEDREGLEKTIDELLDLAASAPYHYKCDRKFQEEENTMNSCLPFRCYVLEATTCRELVDYAHKNNLELKKLKNMLNAADTLFLVTWLPSNKNEKESTSSSDSFLFEGSLTNMEHIAAASAAIQNILIGATARDIPNYWSSGGALRERFLRSFLEISMEEIFLGAVFLFPKNIEEKDILIKLGGLRNSGKEKESWSKIIKK